MSALRGANSEATARSAERIRRSLRDLLSGVRGEALAPLTLALGIETLALSLPVRAGLAYIGGEILLALAGAHGGPWVAELALLAPFAWPALALLAPFPSGWWWREREGGRAPSQRERLAYEDSVAALQHQATEDLRLPADWFVLDSPQLDAAVCGETLMLSRRLLESEHVTAVLAHELGHLAAGDGRLAAALNRLLILRRERATDHEAERPRGRRPLPAEAYVSPIAETAVLLARLAFRACALILELARGGLGLRLIAPALDAHWREREWAADAFAARLGQAEQLADFLEAHALIHDGPAPFLWRRTSAHPPVELRIDRLRDAVAGERS